MALFFDQPWFDARLVATGSTREDLARLLGLSTDQIAEVWKDQRELRAYDVSAMARFLNVSVADVALRAGVSTPTPHLAAAPDARVEQLEGRVAELERMMHDVLARLRRDDVK